MSRDIVVLTDVYIALGDIREFITGLSEAEFVNDERTSSAVLMKLIIIGEAVKRLTPNFRQVHADVKWKEYAGFRDVLIHQYDDVNLNTVWDIVANELPKFFAQVERILPNPPI